MVQQYIKERGRAEWFDQPTIEACGVMEKGPKMRNVRHIPEPARTINAGMGFKKR